MVILLSRLDKDIIQMESPFIFDRYVTGKYFIGRKRECNILRNLLEQKENVCIYGPPKTGKMSVIRQTIFNMRMAGGQFTVADVDLFNVRSTGAFLKKFGTAVIRSVASAPSEYEEIIRELLPRTNFSFDHEKFSAEDEILTLGATPDGNDIRGMLSLPGRIAAARDTSMFVIVEDFHNLLRLPETEYENIFHALSEVFGKQEKNAASHAAFILTGSKTNAMKFIFEERKYFYRQVEHLPVSNIDERDQIDHVVRGFLTAGKVVDNELIAGVVKLFRGNIWYLNHFASVCDSLSKGYMNEGILMDALGIMISIHEPGFKAITDDLSVYQLSFLRAVLEGESRFSSTEAVEKYGMNSSANVRRVKDALKKKEIITFNEKEEPVFLDPLFEYWMDKYYFERQ